MEYCDGGDIATLIKQSQGKKMKIEEKTVWKIFGETADALNYCHKQERKVLHRDLKPGNVFLKKTRVKLGDFGLSRVMGEESVFAKTHVGTPYYMSPEQIAGKRYNEKSDIWSLACVMYELASGQPPFKAQNQMQLAKMIAQGNLKPLEGYSESLMMLISKMMH